MFKVDVLTVSPSVSSLASFWLFRGVTKNLLLVLSASFSIMVTLSSPSLESMIMLSPLAIEGVGVSGREWGGVACSNTDRNLATLWNILFLFHSVARFLYPLCLLHADGRGGVARSRLPDDLGVVQVAPQAVHLPGKERMGQLKNVGKIQSVVDWIQYRYAGKYVG